jgi:hypothetical protein
VAPVVEVKMPSKEEQVRIIASATIYPVIFLDFKRSR